MGFEMIIILRLVLKKIAWTIKYIITGKLTYQNDSLTEHFKKIEYLN